MKPWDARLANALVRPLRDTPVRPNHLTTVRLAVGLAAVWFLARGALDLGAGLFAVSSFLDHTDGELARMTGKTSRFGHRYDLAVDFAVTVLGFTAMGVGLRGQLGAMAPLLGVVAGASIAGIFLVFAAAERELGKQGAALQARLGFEAEDCLYLVAPVTWVGLLPHWLVLSAIGAPAFALWLWRRNRARLAAAGRLRG